MAVSIIAWIERCPSSWEARNITKSHQTTNLKQQTSHNTFIGRGKQNPRGWLPLSGEKLQQTEQDTQLIWSFLGRSGWNFQGGAFQGRDWWDFMSIDWAFHPVGWGQNPIVRVVRAFCGMEPGKVRSP